MLYCFMDKILGSSRPAPTGLHMSFKIQRKDPKNAKGDYLFCVWVDWEFFSGAVEFRGLEEKLFELVAVGLELFGLSLKGDLSELH